MPTRVWHMKYDQNGHYFLIPYVKHDTARQNLTQSTALIVCQHCRQRI